MKITRFKVNPFEEMCYILWHEDEKDAYIVDPGMMYDAEREMVDKFITDHKLNVKKVLVTHMHVDHVASATWAAKHYGASIDASKNDEFMGKSLNVQAQMFGLNITVDDITINNYLKDGDKLELNGETIEVMETPGHSKGSLSFYSKESESIIVGDLVFNGSIGRTDLPGGDYDELISAIKGKILPLPADTIICPGHGNITTVKDEKNNNPFLA